MIDPLEALNNCLKGAQAVGDKAAGECLDQDRLHWLERLLANVVARLQGMIMDIESGLSIRDLGFDCDGDFEEAIGDMEVEIANLKSQIQMLKAVRR